jgi:hypothetical protein
LLSTIYFSGKRLFAAGRKKLAPHNWSYLRV